MQENISKRECTSLLPPIVKTNHIKSTRERERERERERFPK